MPIVGHFTPILVISAILFGSLGLAAFISHPAYADAKDYTTQKDCEDNKFTWDDATKQCTDPNATSCNVEGVGWIVCPVMTFLANVGDTSFNFLSDSFLATNTDYFGPDPTTGESSVERAWNIMRTLANVVFVIAFMVIIYSQLTSTGITNYGVKKMLPRLIIAAILVNASYIICQLAIDISNVLGYSFKQLFDSIGGFIKPSVDPNAAPPGDGSWLLLITGLLAGGVTLWFTLGGGLIIAAVLALLLIVFILVARIALIIVLTVISPLAFVAFLLPNTEPWFKKWYKMFFALLLVFPIVSIVFGASSMTAAVINGTPIPPGDDGWMIRLTAMAVAAIPLFVVPGLLKNAISAAGSIGTKLAGMADKRQAAIGSRAKGNAAERYSNSRLGQFNKHRANQRAIRRQLTQGGAYTGKNPLRRMASAANKKFNNSALSGEFGNRAAANAEAFADELFEKDVKAASLTQNGMTHDQKLALARAEEGSMLSVNGKQVRATKEQKTAAMDSVMATGGFNQRRQMLEHIAANGSQNEKARAVKAAYAKGDQNIYGVGFGDQILSGAIDNEASLAEAAVTNAAGGNLQAEHVVQSGGATEWLQDNIANSGNQDAMNGFRTAADRARASDNTASKIDGKMETAFTSAGSYSQSTTSSSGSEGDTNGISGGSTVGDGGSGSSAPSGASPSGAPVLNSGWEEHPSGLIVPHGTTTDPGAIQRAQNGETMMELHKLSGSEEQLPSKKSIADGISKVSDEELAAMVKQSSRNVSEKRDKNRQAILSAAIEEGIKRNSRPPSPPPAAL